MSTFIDDGSTNDGSTNDGMEQRAEQVRPLSRTRLFVWSVRRELWEYRSLYLAPLAVAALVLVAFVIGTLHLPHIIVADKSLHKGPVPVVPPVGIAYMIATVAVMATGIIVGVFYCLGALHNERRDRSILFWKSLPVSDSLAVAAKMTIPLVVLPVILFTIIILMQLVMLITSPLVIWVAGSGVPKLWGAWPILPQAVVLLYGLATLSLWLLPIYGWLLLVSVWARRVPFLWAVLPPLALSVAEQIAFGTNHVSALLTDRLFGAFNAAFAPNGGMPIQLSQLTPLRFVRTPGLWIGLGFGLGFIAAAIRLRRYANPL
ncbi:MAG: hypothetical protein ACP5M1_12815 [Acidiphilium sp.]